MTRMHNPPHPGEVLREYLGEMSITAVAKQLGVGRVTLQRVVSGSAGISPDMAYRLAAAFGTSPELWAGMLCNLICMWPARSKGQKLNGSLLDLRPTP